LTTLLDGKYKTVVVNGTKRYMMQQGYSWESVNLREAGPVVFNGVLKDGYENTDTPTINSIGVKLGDLSQGYSGVDPNWIETNVSYVRLAELRFSYTINKNWLEKNTRKIMSAASVYVAGTDLFIWTNYTGIDPVGNSNSAALGGTGGIGQDMYSIAPPRGVSLGINVTF
jgi:hypothetical protein